MPGFALFFEQGCGKTGAVINIIRKKYEAHNGLLRTLILAPVIVLQNWKREILMHSNIPSERICVLTGSGKKRLDTFEKFKEKFDAFITITNYETLPIREVYPALVDWSADILVCDESQKLKNPTSKRTRKATELSELARYRYILSGTPILNSPLDIFSQFKILDGGERFGSNFYSFRCTYFYDENAAFKSRHSYFPKWQIRPDAYKKISDLIAQVGMVVKKEECMDLPPLVNQVIQVEMTAEQQRIYRAMEKDFIAFLGSAQCVAQLALTKALRLLEISSGYVKLDTGEIIPIKDNPRTQALKEILEDIAPHHKVIVWAVFRENYKEIRKVCEALNLQFVEVTGDVSNTEKFRNVDAFNLDPSVRVLIGNQGAGGIGIGLQAASYMVYYSRDFSLEHDLQSEARAHRGGSEIHEKITRIDLVCPETIDELVLKKLAMKEEIGENVLQSLRENQYS